MLAAFLLAASAGSGATVTVDLTGNATLNGTTYPWESVTGATLTVESSNLSAARVTGNGTLLEFAVPNVSLSVGWATIGESNPDNTSNLNGSWTIQHSSYQAGFPSNQRGREVFGPIGVSRAWTNLSVQVSYGKWNDEVEVMEAPAPVNISNVTWNNQPNWSAPLWRSGNSSVLQQPIPLFPNGTLLRYVNEFDSGGLYGPVSSLYGVEKSGSITFSTSTFDLPLAVNGGNLTGTVTTDAVNVSANASINGVNVSGAAWTLSGNNMTFHVDSLNSTIVKAGTYSAAALYGGLGCEGGNVSFNAIEGASLYCKIIGSTPQPVARPVSPPVSGGGGGGGGGGAAPAVVAATPSPTPSPTATPNATAAPVKNPTDMPNCEAGAEPAFLRGSWLCLPRNLTANVSANTTIGELAARANGSGLERPIPSPGFEAVFAVVGLLGAAWARRRIHG